MLARRQPTLGCRGPTDVDTVEADDRAGHVGDDAQATELRGNTDRRLDRRPLVGSDRDHLRKRLVALPRAPDLDQVLALAETIHDQWSPTASLSIDEDGYAGHVCVDQKRTGSHLLRLQRDGDRHHLTSNQLHPFREGDKTTLPDLHQVPAGGECLAQRHVARGLAVNTYGRPGSSLVACGNHDDRWRRILRERLR